MLPPKTTFRNADEYIAMFPEPTREKLQSLRVAIKKAAPGAEELISYKMPAFKLNGMLVWFRAGKEHVGFYPTASPIRVFRKELAPYKTSKGAIRFPLEKRIPVRLVTAIVKFRVKENLEKAKKK